MVVHLRLVLAVLADAGLWLTWSVAVGLLGARWSPDRVGHDGPVTTLRRFEGGGRLYRRLGIRHWKRLLPDAGRFGGGRRKDLRRRLDRAEWKALAGETRRAERVHWLIILALPLTAVWSRGVLLAAMIAYALAANLPCIAAQRYNRVRLLALDDLARSRHE